MDDRIIIEPLRLNKKSAPSQEEIAERAASIRRRWSAKERRKRNWFRTTPIVLTPISLADKSLPNED